MAAAKIWVPNKDSVYVIAEIISEDGDSFIIGDGQKVPKSKSHLLDPSHLLDLRDLCHMNSLHEAPLLDMLRRRLLDGTIYTNTGNVLISINPYKTIPGLYENPVLYLDLPDDGDEEDDEQGVVESSPTGGNTLPPHVFKIGNNALRALMREQRNVGTAPANHHHRINQSVIISGESGAGKTEASKHVMSFLIEANELQC